MKLLIEHLGKRYKHDFWGLRDFTLEIGPGIVGLLGPNGAGKSSLMRILATITRPTEGTVNWNGVDVIRHPNKLRTVLGYLPQDFGIYPNLSVNEFLEYMAAIKGLSGKIARQRIDELIQVVNLESARKQLLKSVSGGMKQRVGIAQALLNDPQLLIVDEPTVGLDPEERIRFRALLADLSGERVVLLSTHIVSDIEAVAEKIVIMNHGRLLAHESSDHLLSLVKGKVWELVVPAERQAQLREQYIVSNTTRHGNEVSSRIISPTAPTPDARQVAVVSLEDAYLYVISQQTRPAQPALTAAGER